MSQYETFGFGCGRFSRIKGACNASPDVELIKKCAKGPIMLLMSRASHEPISMKLCVLLRQKSVFSSSHSHIRYSGLLRSILRATDEQLVYHVQASCLWPGTSIHCQSALELYPIGLMQEVIYSFRIEMYDAHHSSSYYRSQKFSHSSTSYLLPQKASPFMGSIKHA